LQTDLQERKQKNHYLETTPERKTFRKNTTNENVTHVKSTIHET
jgi:hypothetical protein